MKTQLCFGELTLPNPKISQCFEEHEMALMVKLNFLGQKKSERENHHKKGKVCIGALG